MSSGRARLPAERRRLIAFVGHAPGLWLIYREPLPKRLRVTNLLAFVVTAGAMAAVYRVAPRPWNVRGALLVWLAGHFAWGVYLANHPDASKRPGRQATADARRVISRPDPGHP